MSHVVSFKQADYIYFLVHFMVPILGSVHKSFHAAIKKKKEISSIEIRSQTKIPGRQACLPMLYRGPYTVLNGTRLSLRLCLFFADSNNWLAN